LSALGARSNSVCRTTNQKATRVPSRDELKAEVLAANKALIEAIRILDYETYASLCSPNMTCFDPEARGTRVKGLDFHRFYFDLAKTPTCTEPADRNENMVDPEVVLLGTDGAVVTYARLVQEARSTRKTEETRCWKRTDVGWKLVHFHRSNVV
jgi:calcium/calmodulin-dependent protein kinase (CaM kinase) II